MGPCRAALRRGSLAAPGPPALHPLRDLWRLPLAVADHAAQLDWKRSIVAGQLRHLGRLADPDVRATVAPSGPYGYRNRMDFSVDGGRPALFRGRSRSLVPIEHCWLLEPALADLFDRLGPLDGVERLTVRVGVATGEAVVVLTGEVPPQAADWEASVVRRHHDGYEAIIGDPWISEEVTGHRFRISADAFFQNSTPAAAALVRLVHEALQPSDDDVLLDGYAGGGLFSVALAGSVARVVAVESNQLAADDLRFNTAGKDNVEVVKSRMERLRPDDPWTVAVVDPPRAGLGEEGVRAVTATMPRTLVYVSCDPASLAREAKALVDHGYDLDHATPVTSSRRPSTSRPSPGSPSARSDVAVSAAGLPSGRSPARAGRRMTRDCAAETGPT